MKEKVVFFFSSILHGAAQQFSTITLSIMISVEPVVDTCVYMYMYNGQIVVV